MLLGQCGQWVLLLPFHLLNCSLGACIYFPPCLRLKENTSPVHRQDTFFWFSLSLAAGGASGKEPTCKCRWCRRHGFDPWVGKVSWWRAWQPTSVFLLGESHGQRSLAGHSPWGCQELKKPEQLNCTISSRTSLEGRDFTKSKVNRRVGFSPNLGHPSAEKLSAAQWVLQFLYTTPLTHSFRRGQLKKNARERHRKNSAK